MNIAFLRFKIAISVMVLLLFSFFLQTSFARERNRNLMLIAVWGKTGEGPGEFNEPMGIAVDKEGNVYIADSRNARIQKFSSEGDFLLSWGDRAGLADQGDGNGRFSKPVDIAVNSNGDVYVADYDNDIIQQFRSDGTYLGQWGKSGKAPGEFTVAAGLALDPKRKRVYLAEFYNKRVEAYDLHGHLLFQVGTPGRIKSGALNYPADIALDAAGNIYVADAYNHRIQKFSPDGKFLDKWGGIFGLGMPGSFPGWFRVPSGVAVDENGRIFVADSANHRVVVMSERGKIIDSWKLDIPTELYSPTRIATGYGNRIYAADTANDRVLVFEFKPWED